MARRSVWWMYKFMSKKIILFPLLFIISILISKAQNKDKKIDDITANIEQQLQLFPQEKIYLQCDRWSYISGETVWFRIYIQDAITHRPSEISRYAYVELINEQLSVVCRIKIKPDDDTQLHYGYLTLPDDLPEGNYRLRTYTRYLCNLGEDYFYSKNIRVFNPKNARPDKEQKQESLDYDVTLFPEGGYLLEGTLCQVAFKAINESGLHEDIEGELTDENGAVLQAISSYYNGMGRFFIEPVAGKRYYLSCTNKQGKRKRYELPAAKPDACSLSAKTINNEYLYLSVLKSKEIIPSTPLFLLIHTSGIIQYLSPVENTDNPLVFDKKRFPSGIAQIVLMDMDLNPLSERLVFIQNDDQAEVSVKSNQAEYSNREKVSIETEITDSGNNLLQGDFSVSVIDGNDTKPDTSSTILTTLLLTSELKGYVENPGFYFQADNPQSRQALDLLMQTQGWRRYDIPETVRGNYAMPVVKPEQAQTLGGKVIREGAFKNEDLKHGKVMLFVPGTGFVEETETDAEGRFSFENFELPDSIKYVVQVLTGGNNANVNLRLDENTFPPIASYTFPRKEETVPVPDREYIAKAERKYTMEKGMRMIQLKEVEITAPRKEEKKSIYAKVPSYSVDRVYIDKYKFDNVSQVLRRMPGVNVFAGRVFLRGRDIQKFKSKAVIIIDDIIVNQHFPEDIPDGRQGIQGISIDELVNILDVERIDIVNSSGAALLGSKGGNGAIVITIRTGESRIKSSDNTKLNIKTVMPLGYQKLAEFYSPKYETKEEKNSATPDLRTTIFWKPDVLIDKGKAYFDFYTADSSSTYFMVIEGVSLDGKLIHQVSQLEVISDQ